MPSPQSVQVSALRSLVNRCPNPPATPPPCLKLRPPAAVDLGTRREFLDALDRVYTDREVDDLPNRESLAQEGINGGCAVSRAVIAAAAADLENNAVALDVDLVPVKAPVPYRLHSSDAFAEPEGGCRVLLRAHTPANGAALKLKVGDEAAGAFLSKDANVGDVVAARRGHRHAEQQVLETVGLADLLVDARGHHILVVLICGRWHLGEVE